MTDSLADQVRMVEDRAASAAAFAEALDRMRVRGVASDGTTVTVTHTGALTNLQMPDWVPPGIAESVLAAVADAHRSVAAQVRELALDGLGPEVAATFGEAWDTALGVQ